MKKVLKYLLPLFIALFSFLFYIFLYNPPVKSEDFTTALLVFFTVLGAAAIIIFHTKENRVLLILYASVSILLPAILLFFVNITKVNRPLHPITLGITIVGFISGKLFIDAHHRRKKQE